MRRRRWLGAALLAVAVLVLAALGYGGWRLGHPALPKDSVTLAAGRAPAGQVTAHYLGTTTLLLDDGAHRVMVDALLTRPGLRAVLFGKVASDPALVDAALARAEAPRIDLLLVTHSHYDHALDIAAVARRTGATIVGSASTAMIARGGGVAPDRIAVARPGERFGAGDFRVTVLAARHSADDRIPGMIDAPLHQPASVKAYREGGTDAYLIEHRGLRILVHASAGFIPGAYRDVRADVVFLAIGGLAAQPAAVTRRYWREVVGATGARLVVPIHWDDFLAPPGRPLVPLRRFMDDIPLTLSRLAPLAARDRVAIRYMPLAAPVDLAAAARRER